MALRVTPGRILDRAADKIGPDVIGPDVAELAQRRDDLVWREPPRERARVKVRNLLRGPRDVFHRYKVIESGHCQPLMVMRRFPTRIFGKVRQAIVSIEDCKSKLTYILFIFTNCRCAS